MCFFGVVVCIACVLFLAVHDSFDRRPFDRGQGVLF